MIYLSHREWKNYTTNNSVIPKWVKNTEVSGCPGLVNYVTEGLVILSDADYEFETSDGEMVPWNTHTEENVSIHRYGQAKIHKPEYTIVKINVGIMLRHEENSRLTTLLMNYDPLDSSVQVMPAIFPLLDVWSPLLINTIYEDGHHLIKKGDPIARIMINYSADLQYEDVGLTNYNGMMHEWMKLKVENNILSTFTRESKKCPFHSQ